MMLRSLSARKRVVVFDLDDTLYKEMDYLLSAYREIAKFVTRETGCTDVFEQMMESYARRENVFETLIRTTGVQCGVDNLLVMYRCHRPCISLAEDVRITLATLSEKEYVLGIITDGREVTQMNKIDALGLPAFIPKENIVISESFGSEKPCEDNYRYFMNRFPEACYCYVGDNVKKDFVAPNRLGWETFRIQDSDGRNIHPSSETVDAAYDAKCRLIKLSDLLHFI